MSELSVIAGEPLAGYTVLLVAGWTNDDRVEPPRMEQIEEELGVDEAVLSVGRAVFARGGRIALVGDLDVALLLGMVAGEYRTDRPAEDLRREEERPAPQLLWLNPEPWDRERREAGAEPYPLELLESVGLVDRPRPHDSDLQGLLREVVRPGAVVCIGSPAGLEREDLLRFAALVQPGRSYAFTTPGGLAASLIEREEFRTPDRDVQSELRELLRSSPRDGDAQQGWDERRMREERAEGVSVPRLPPYPLIAQIVAEEIGEGRGTA